MYCVIRGFSEKDTVLLVLSLALLGILVNGEQWRRTFVKLTVVVSYIAVNNGALVLSLLLFHTQFTGSL